MSDTPRPISGDPLLLDPAADDYLPIVDVSEPTMAAKNKRIKPGTLVGQAPFTQTGTGAVARTVDSKLKDAVSVRDFGAVGDGVADDATAFQKILDLTGSVTCRVPKGTYRLAASPVLGNATEVRWIFEAGASLTGTGTLPFTPQKGQLNGSPVIPTVPQISLIQGNSTAPRTDLDKKTPAIYIERHTNSNPADSSDWGNLRNSAPLEIETVVYGAETGSQNCIIGRVYTDTARVAGGSVHQNLVGASFLAQSNAPAGQNNRDCFSINAVAASVRGNNPDNLVCIEADCIPTDTMPALRPGQAGAKNVTAYWAQAASPVANSNTGLYISSVSTTYGWLYGICADAPFHEYAAYFRTTLNVPNAKGVRIEAQWGGDSGRLLECFIGNNREQFRVDGDAGNAVWIRVGGSLKKVQVGAPDSGGPGFRMLTVAN